MKLKGIKSTRNYRMDDPKVIDDMFWGIMFDINYFFDTEDMDKLKVVNTDLIYSMSEVIDETK
ncbi:MAG: hypothetical protein WC554_18725 [Clostridia bacterium]